MLGYFWTLFGADSLSPHGICLLWRPELVWTHVVSDAAIAAAYFGIPVGLAYFVRRRRDVAFTWIFWCFAAFILACGCTHLMSILTLWRPYYGVEALIKAVTAAASLATAGAIWQLLPQAVALPSPAQLKQMNDDLARRVDERDAALAALHEQMTARSKAEEMLRQAQKMEAIGQLAGGVAHDFNNLMMAALMSLDNAQKHVTRDSEKALIMIANARAAANRAAKLTDQLLAFARQQPLQPESFRVDRLIEELAPLLEQAVKETGEIKLCLGCEGGTVKADQQQLAACLLNLVVNARDALSNRGVITVSTSCSTLPATGMPAILIEVADTGIGISSDIVMRVFDPFFTTKPVGKGSGLGLSQVYGFVQQSGGDVSVDSTPGVGTKMRIYLPRTWEVAMVDDVILVVEDEPLVRFAMVALLEGAGFSVHAAEDGRAAIEIIEAGHRLDALITDIRMPGVVDGWAVAERARRRHRNIPVIYVTGFSSERGREVPGSVTLKKPATIETILQTLARFGLRAQSAD
jgi:signal transduction histidine kinase/CheY-like chemotaxis protein